jgi:hydroxymethylglutaryl-CoA reductase
MGANAVNTMAELISGKVEEITGGRVHLRILSNLASQRLARV